MNEAQIGKQNLWKKGLKVAAVGYLALSTATFTTYAFSKEAQYNKLNHLTEETSKTLNETKSKVEIQDKELKKLIGVNAGLEELKEDNTDTIMELTTKLRNADTKMDAQQAKIEQLEADLKKKRASRAKSSAAPATASVNVKRASVSSSTSGMQQFRSTAYSYGTTTASGTHVGEGRTIAVDPRLIPLGSKVKIVCPSYPSINGVYTAEDTGRLIKGNIIDVYMASHSKAIDFGRRTLYVEVLNQTQYNARYLVKMQEGFHHDVIMVRTGMEPYGDCI